MHFYSRFCFPRSLVHDWCMRMRSKFGIFYPSRVESITDLLTCTCGGIHPGRVESASPREKYVDVSWVGSTLRSPVPVSIQARRSRMTSTKTFSPCRKKRSPSQSEANPASLLWTSCVGIQARLTNNITVHAMVMLTLNRLLSDSHR